MVSESEGLGLQPGSDTYELPNLEEVTSLSLLSHVISKRKVIVVFLLQGCLGITFVNI